MIGVKGRSNYASAHKNLNNALAAAAATVLGGVYAIDLYRANAGSVDTDTSLNNIVAVDATNIAGCRYVVAEEVAANGVNVKCVQAGICSALVDGTTDVAPGDFLKPVSGQNYLVKCANALEIAELGIAQLVDAAYTTDATQTLRLVDFFGSQKGRSNQ